MVSKKRVLFRLDAPGAESVQLRGEFNGWGIRELQQDRKGVWRTWIMLPPGRFQYRFVVDGAQKNDPRAEHLPNNFGSTNSVHVVA